MSPFLRSKEGNVSAIPKYEKCSESRPSLDLRKATVAFLDLRQHSDQERQHRLLFQIKEGYKYRPSIDLRKTIVAFFRSKKAIIAANVALP